MNSERIGFQALFICMSNACHSPTLDLVRDMIEDASARGLKAVKQALTESARNE